MQASNPEIRERIAQAGLTQWQIAQEVGISHVTLNVWLRTPLTDEREARIIKAIDTLEAHLQHA